jgi:hypothetical protein
MIKEKNAEITELKKKIANLEAKNDEKSQFDIQRLQRQIGAHEKIIKQK